MATARLALPVTYVGSQITRGAVVVTRVVLLALVAASHLARPVAYVGISRRMRVRFAGLLDTFDTLRGVEIPFQSARFRPGAADCEPLRGVVRATLQTGGSQSSLRAQWRPIGAAPRGGALVLQTGCSSSRSWSSNGSVQAKGGIRSPKAATTSRGCGRRALCRRWRWRHWWPRRRFATPRPLAFSAPSAPSNEGLQQSRWALRSAQVPIAGC